MANPFANMAGGQRTGPLGKILIQSFNQFASAFTGDPKQKVQELLNSGRMTQEQFNQLQEMARWFQQFLPK